MDLEKLEEEVDRAPTRLSIEAIRDVCCSLKSGVQQDFERFKNRARPSLSVANLLGSTCYIPTDTGTILVTFELESKVGSAPVEGVELRVEGTNEIQQLKAGFFPGVVYGGDRRDVQAELLFSARVETGEVITKGSLTYHDRTSGTREECKFTTGIHVDRSARFTPIKNRYRHYAGGTAVKNPDMFFGRQELLGRIKSHVTDGPGRRVFRIIRSEAFW